MNPCTWPNRPFRLTIFISPGLRIPGRPATIIFVSLSARSLVLIAALLPSAGATTITILPADNLSQAIAERNSWLTQTFGAGATADPVNVNLQDQSPHGRSDVTKFELLTSFQSLYFFMTGVDGNVQIRTADGTSASIHDGDGGIYFVGINSTTTIQSIQWSSNEDFKLKNFGTPRLPGDAPEPRTWLAVATGVIAITRRYRVPFVPSPAAPSIGRWAKPAWLLRRARGRHNRGRT